MLNNINRGIKVVFYWVMFWATILNAQPNESRNIELLKREFTEKYGNNWKMKFSENLKMPVSIHGGFIDQYTGTPIEISKQFLSENKTLFGINNIYIDLQKTKVSYTDKGGSRITFSQIYKGVRVYTGSYLVAVNNENSIYYVSGDYFPDINLGVIPRLQKNKIISIIENDFKQKVTTYPELYILPNNIKKDRRYSLAYLTDATDGVFENWKYFHDAHTGVLLKKINLNENINGLGRVYDTNPYHGNSVTRTLYRLRNIFPRKLDGTNIKVLNTTGSEASSYNANFLYPPTNTHFDEVMVYYHSDKFETFMINLGMDNTTVGKVTAYTNHQSLYAAANGVLLKMYFSNGFPALGLRNPTRESAVICHEYMHIVSETYNSLIQNIEADAMDESYSDYFGLAYKNQFVNSSIQGEYIDVPGGYNWARDLDNNYMYSELNTINADGYGSTSEHDRSLIFSGGLWDFRSDPDVITDFADELVLESLNNLDDNPTFEKGRTALIAAAISSGYSDYEDDIIDAFYGHGIGDPPIGPLAVSIVGPANLNGGQSGSFNAEATGGSENYVNYIWWKRNDGGLAYDLPIGEWFEIYGWEGLQTVQTSGWDDFSLKCEVTDSNGDIDLDIHHINVSSFPPNPKIADNNSQFIPNKFDLKNNFPNPFNPVTKIIYDLPEGSKVILTVFDLNGVEIKQLVNSHLPSGRHVVSWGGKDHNGYQVSTGIYIYQFTAISKETNTVYTHSNKMVLMK